MATKIASKKQQLQVLLLDGPFTVVYRREGRQWLCIALQFSLHGVGDSKEEALHELKELFHSYLEDALRSEEASEFFLPADARDWQRPDQHSFRVALVIDAADAEEMPTKRPSLANISELKALALAVRAIDLVPVNI